MNDNANRTVHVATGPRGWPFVGNIPEMLTEPLAFLKEMARTNGKVSRFRLGPLSAFLVDDADMIAHILTNQHFRRSKNFARLAPLIGTELAASEGDAWRTQRRMIRPAFTSAAIAATIPVMYAETLRMLSAWPTHSVSAPFDIAKSFRQLTLRIAAKTLFGADISDDDLVRYGKAFSKATYIIGLHMRANFAFPRNFPTPDNIILNRSLAVLNGIADGIISQRRKKQDGQMDLLAALMDSRREDGSTLSDEEIRNWINGLLFAGHETTSHSLSWLIASIGNRPDVQRDMRREALQASPHHIVPTVASLRAMKYGKQVLSEMLRLYGPAWAIDRHVERGTIVDGYRFPEGGLVVISAYVTHRNPRYWGGEPERFDPGHFSEERSAGRLPCAYFPFGFGPHQCLGMHFAMMEMQIVASLLVQTYEFELVEPERIVPQAQITMRPKHGVTVRIRPLV